MELLCGACPKQIRLDARGELVHADGTEMCLAEERVFPSLEGHGIGDEEVRVRPVLADEDAPAWAKLDTRHRLQVGSWEQRQEERAPWTYSWGVVLLFVLLVVGVCLAGFYVVSAWPTSTYK